MDFTPANVKRYLDLSSAHLTEQQMERIAGGPSTVVIKHGYGCWVHVPDTDTEQALLDDASNDEDAIDWTALIECYDAARDLDCNWINFDTDADELSTLKTHDW